MFGVISMSIPYQSGLYISPDKVKGAIDPQRTPLPGGPHTNGSLEG